MGHNPMLRIGHHQHVHLLVRPRQNDNLHVQAAATAQLRFSLLRHARCNATESAAAAGATSAPTFYTTVCAESCTDATATSAGSLALPRRLPAVALACERARRVLAIGRQRLQ